jgi:hypothetical protein
MKLTPGRRIGCPDLPADRPEAATEQPLVECGADAVASCQVEARVPVGRGWELNTVVSCPKKVVRDPFDIKYLTHGTVASVRQPDW